jgi:hypothetical protein
MFGSNLLSVRSLLITTVLAAVVAAAVACGKGGGGEPTEESLKETAQAAGNAVVDGDAPEAYSYLHPDYKAKCPLEDFLGLVLFARAFLGGGDEEEGSDFEYKVLEASVDGDRGTVRSEVTVDGESLGTEPDDGEYWLFEDGEWLLTTEDDEPCGGFTTDDDSDEPEVEPGEITVEKQGYTYDANSGNVSYGIVLSNQEQDIAAESIQLQVAFYDAAGTVIDTVTENVSYLLPGETTGVGGTASGVADMAEMRVQVSADDWREWEEQPPLLTIDNISVTEDDFGGTKVTGEVTNSLDQELESITLYAVFLDAEGNIVGGDFSFLDFVPASGTSAFEITSFVEVPGIATAEVYGQPFFFDLDELE